MHIYVLYVLFHVTCKLLGPIQSSDALKYFNIRQRPPRLIDRTLDELIRHTGRRNDELTDLVKEDTTPSPITSPIPSPIPSNNECSCMDQYWHHEISGKQLYMEYMVRGSPVLVR